MVTPTAPTPPDAARLDRLGVAVLVTGDPSERTALVRPDGAVAASADGPGAIARLAGVVEDVTHQRATVHPLRRAVPA